jgi:hypothetical protein
VTTSDVPLNTGILVTRIESPESRVKDITIEAWLPPTEPNGCQCYIGHSHCSLHLDEEEWEEEKALRELKQSIGFVGDFHLHQRWFHYNEDTHEEIDEFANICKKFTNDKGFFTVTEVVDCVVEFEKEARQLKCWHGAVDAHHVYFEGFYEYKDKDGNEFPHHYSVSWGHE